MISPSLKLALGQIGAFAAAGALILLLVLPVPGWLLDLLLALNLGAAVMLVVVAARSRGRAALLALPSALLLGTVARLAIEIAATRAILTHRDVGALIPAVGRVALGGDWIVGAGVFVVLVGLQYAVIARGAERVAEVAARFSLDAVPGRQMSIDAALRAGVIESPTAIRERARLDEESAFHAAMDGAMKFVRGDALAGAMIAAVNLVGGASVGALRDGARVSDALKTYGVLAVGQGLLAQIPSLLCALAAALAVTRSTRDEDLGGSLLSTLRRERGAALGAALLLGCLGLVPGLPTFPFIAAALVAGLLGTSLLSEDPAARVVIRCPDPRRARGFARASRESATGTLGCAVPAVAVSSAREWSIALDGTPIATCADREAARLALDALLLERPSRWFGVDDAAQWLDELVPDAPMLVGSVVPRRLSMLDLTALLRTLLDAGVPVTQRRTILERVADAPAGSSFDELVEWARGALSASITARWAPAASLRAVAISPLMVDALVDAAAKGAASPLGPALRDELRDAMAALPRGAPRVLVASAASRRPIERGLRAIGESFVVLSTSELSGCSIERVATLGPTAASVKAQ